MVGAGPAGMECAIVLGKRGFRRVHLVEAESDLGGSLRWIPLLPGLGEWARLVNWRRIQLEKLKNVEVITGMRLDADGVSRVRRRDRDPRHRCFWAPDGLSPGTHAAIPGADAALPHVLTPEQIMLEGKRPPGERLLVYDCEGDFTGAGLAEKLALEGLLVEFATPLRDITPREVFGAEGALVRKRLHEVGVTARLGLTVTGIEPGRVQAANEFDEPLALDTDGVVLVTQRRSNEALFLELAADRDALAAEGIEALYRIGDCAAPARSRTRSSRATASHARSTRPTPRCRSLTSRAHGRARSHQLVKVLVCVKQIRQLGDEIELAAGGLELVPGSLDRAHNEWDGCAVEEALRIRERVGDGEVVVVTAGDEEATQTLRRYLAMGVDRAIRVDAEPADSIATAHTLLGVVSSERPDLVLTGAQSADAVQGSTGAALAALAGLPCVAVVTQVDWPGSGPLTVERELEGGLVDIVEVDTPALLTIQTGINQPRYVNLRAIKQAEQREITTLAAPGGEPASRLIRLFAPPRGTRAEQLDGGPGAGRPTNRGDREGPARMTVMVVAEHVQGRVRDVTYELISAAATLGGTVVVVVVGGDLSSLDVNREGVDEIVHVRVEQADFESDVYRTALESLIEERQPEAVLLGFTVNSMGYAAGVAARLGLGFASDVFAVSSDATGIRAVRALYGGKVHAELEFLPGRPVLLLLRPTVWPQAAPGAGAVVTDHPLAPGSLAHAACGVPRSREERRRHCVRRLPALDRSRDRRPRECRHVREARGEARRDARRFPADRRRGLDLERAPGRTVRQDGEAEGLPRPRHLGRGPAPRRHEGQRDDHRRQHRSGGGDLRGGALRCGRGSVRRRGGTGEAVLT